LEVDRTLKVPCQGLIAPLVPGPLGREEAFGIDGAARTFRHELCQPGSHKAWPVLQPAGHLYGGGVGVGNGVELRALRLVNTLPLKTQPQVLFVFFVCFVSVWFWTFFFCGTGV
jgi:hypothetical protein